MTTVTASSVRSDPWLPPHAPGDVIADKYRVEQLLGNGGMAWVYLATHLPLHKRVALKFLRVDPNSDNTEAFVRFRREGRAAARISGEATARVLDVGALDDGSPFLVMEYLEGRDLESVVEQLDRLPIDTAVDYAIQACEGLAETHAAGIVHRDLKPANLFLTQTSDGAIRIKLLDFGISKFVDPSSDEFGVTNTRALMGSPVYMSPEQMRSSRRVDRRSDIWSMGVILYELLAAGRSPFSAPTLPEICARVLDEKPAPFGLVRPDVPRALEAVVCRCLEKDPSRRFQTVADLADALVPFGCPESCVRADRIRRILGARRVGPAGVSPGRWRSPRALRIGGIIAFVVLAATATLGLRLADGNADGIAAASDPDPSSHSMPDVPMPRPEAATPARASPVPAMLETEPSAGPTTTECPVVTRAPESLAVARSIPRAPATPSFGSPAAHVVARSEFNIAEFGGRK
jgi:tRNA A-37 threonylcarbamoyl transferase component Bud32